LKRVCSKLLDIVLPDFMKERLIVSKEELRKIWEMARERTEVPNTELKSWVTQSAISNKEKHLD
jgi:hypothetical protein